MPSGKGVIPACFLQQQSRMTPLPFQKQSRMTPLPDPFAFPLPLSVFLLNLSMIAKAINTEATVPALVLWSLAVAYVVGCAVLALLLPARSLHDRLAGTYLVPR